MPPAATAAPAAPALSTATYPLGSVAASHPLPSVGGFSGTVLLPGVSAAPAGAAVTLTSTIGNPCTTSMLLDKQRQAQSGTLTVLFCTVFTTPFNITFNTLPGFTILLPSNVSTFGRQFFYAISDPNVTGVSAQFRTEGPATVSGSQLTFDPSSNPLTLSPGQQYVFAFYATTSGATSASGTVSLLTTIHIPNVPPATGAFSYDIGYVDPVKRLYYLADRTNKALDVIDSTNNTLLAQITGGAGGTFAGVGPTPGQSGPDGVVPIPGTNTVYVGDVNSVKVVDIGSRATVKNIVIGSTGFRADEGCYDADDGIVAMASPNDAVPFLTFISTASQSVMTKLVFGSGALAGTSGLEQCVYDHATRAFYINNDGTTINPSGELDRIPAQSVVAGTPVVDRAIPLPNCVPAGLAAGPNEVFLVGCDPDIGDPEITMLVNVVTGTIRTITQVGGEDEVWYNPGDNRFYTASRNWTATGISQSARTPVLGVIDAASGNWLQNVPTGANAHSVTADPVNNHVFVPVPTGINVYGTGP